MSLAEMMREERRLLILKALQEPDDRTLSDSALQIVLKHLAYRTPRDVLRADLQWLADQHLVRLDKRTDGDDLWVVALAREGLEVADGRKHPGIARPLPR